MNKKIIIAIALVFLISFTKVKALCSNSELNDLAEKFKVVYTEDTARKVKTTDGKILELGRDYAYFLVFSPYSEKIKIEVTNSLNGDKQMAEYNRTQKTYVIGSYIHFDPKEYTIKVYGADNSVCAGELLKTTSITVPRFNDYSLYEYCTLNRTEDICSMMKDTTNVSLEEFKEIAEKNEEKKKVDNMTTLEMIKHYAIKYGLFIIIPILIISIYYVIKMKQYKKKVRNQ